MPAPDPSILDIPYNQALYDCILELMWSGFSNGTENPFGALEDIALRWVACLSQYINEGLIGPDLDCIRDYVGMVVGECDSLENFQNTNYLQEATNLTDACIILDSLIQSNNDLIIDNSQEIENIYNLLGKEDPIIEQPAGSQNKVNRTFTLSQPARNALGGREIEVFHNGGRFRQIADKPLGRLFRVLDTGLTDGFNTIELGFAPNAGADIVVRYFPI
jgi:hypothetical protein